MMDDLGCPACGWHTHRVAGKHNPSPYGACIRCGAALAPYTRRPYGQVVLSDDGQTVRFSVSGKAALLDSADGHLLACHAWRVGAAGYVQAGPRGSLLLHRLVMQPGPGFQVDHINGDKLDNRRCNLRNCTGPQNRRNRPSLPHSSRFKGVTRLASGRWQSCFRKRYLGRFDTPEEAARAWDAAARPHHGAFGRYNFPVSGENPAAMEAA